MAVLTNTQYFGITTDTLSLYKHKEEEVPAPDFISRDEADRMKEQVKMEMMVKLDDQYNDLSNQIEALHEELEEVRGLAKKKVSAPRKPKEQHEKKNSGGANHSLQATLQKDGKLAPFREGGCKCRTWGDRMGTQCSNVAKEDGMCKMHFNKVEKQGSWQLGFYNEPRPEVWGMGHDGVEINFPNHEKEGGKIGWRMSEEVFKVAFARDVLVEEEPMEFDHADTEPLPEGVEDVANLDDVMVPEPPKEEPPVCLICPDTHTECSPLGDINICYSCKEKSAPGKYYFPKNGAGESTGLVEPLCETCYEEANASEEEWSDDE